MDYVSGLGWHWLHFLSPGIALWLAFYLWVNEVEKPDEDNRRKVANKRRRSGKR